MLYFVRSYNNTNVFTNCVTREGHTEKYFTTNTNIEGSRKILDHNTDIKYCIMELPFRSILKFYGPVAPRIKSGGIPDFLRGCLPPASDHEKILACQNLQNVSKITTHERTIHKRWNTEKSTQKMPHHKLTILADYRTQHFNLTINSKGQGADAWEKLGGQYFLFSSRSTSCALP